MIYTIGHTQNYIDAIRRSLKTDTPGIQKVGKNDSYEGGYAFATLEIAESYLKKIKKDTVWCVWGLDCTMQNTYMHESKEYHLIIENTDIIPLFEITE